VHIIAPVTDYIPASVLTTHGDMVVRGAADPERLAIGALTTFLKGGGAGAIPLYDKLHLSDTGVHIGNGTRGSAGAQVITGVGYRSSGVFFFAGAAVVDNTDFSWGFDNGTVHNCIPMMKCGAVQSITENKSIHIVTPGGEEMGAEISLMSDDGFTLTWFATLPFTIVYTYFCLP